MNKWANSTKMIMHNTRWICGCPSQVRYQNIDEGPTSEHRTLDLIVDEEDHATCQLSADDNTHSSRKKRNTDVALELISMNINDLWPFSEIEASVNVINSVGVGTSGNPIRFKTLEGGNWLQCNGIFFLMFLLFGMFLRLDTLLNRTLCKNK